MRKRTFLINQSGSTNSEALMCSFYQITTDFRYLYLQYDLSNRARSKLKRQYYLVQRFDIFGLILTCLILHVTAAYLNKYFDLNRFYNAPT